MRAAFVPSALLCCALLVGSAAAWAQAPTSEAFDVDDTIREVMLSLDASYVDKVPLDRYALFGLDGLAAVDPCLARRGGPDALSVSCGAASFSVAWPPKKAVDVARLLSDAARLVVDTRNAMARRGLPGERVVKA